MALEPRGEGVSVLFDVEAIGNSGLVDDVIIGGIESTDDRVDFLRGGARLFLAGTGFTCIGGGTFSTDHAIGLRCPNCGFLSSSSLL